MNVAGCHGASQGLTKLRILWLCDNPCSSHPLYRPFILRMCPGLVKLDNTGEVECEWLCGVVGDAIPAALGEGECDSEASVL